MLQIESGVDDNGRSPGSCIEYPENAISALPVPLVLHPMATSRNGNLPTAMQLFSLTVE
jgi:hypothetical protein